MACPNTNSIVEGKQCNCRDEFGNELYDLQFKTKRSILNSYKIKWIVEDFPILPMGTIESPTYYPFPEIPCHIELEIDTDDLRIFLCLPSENGFFIHCECSISNNNGQLFYHKSSTIDRCDRYDLTDMSMHSCFPNIKSAVDGKLILLFNLTFHGATVTDIYVLGKCDNSCRFENLKKLSSDLMSAYKNSVNTDIKLIAQGGESLAVHKAVLSARSSVFARMFENNMSENTKKEVNITDVTFDALRKLVEYLYGSELPHLADIASAYDLYYAADKYDILDLRKVCGNLMLSQLTILNACGTLARIDQHDDKPIREKIMQYICLHLKDIVKSEDWVTYMDNRLSAEVIKMIF